MRFLWVVLALAGASGWLDPIRAHGQSNALTIISRESSKTYRARDLLAAARDVRIAQDPVYKRPEVYRAVPMAELLKDVRLGPDDYVQVRAVDDYSASIPGTLLKPAAPTGTEAFLAIETAARPWPAIPGKQGGAGPFYIVWQTSSAAVPRAYWVYRIAALAVTDSPYKRWPSLGVRDALPASDPVWRGRDRFVAVCMACHRFNGDGEGDAGPDLAGPMHSLDYFQSDAHKKLMRDPSSVRNWPGRQMPAFDEATLSNADIDAIMAWLTYKKRTGFGKP